MSVVMKTHDMLVFILKKAHDMSVLIKTHAMSLLIKNHMKNWYS